MTIAMFGRTKRSRWARKDVEEVLDNLDRAHDNLMRQLDLTTRTAYEVRKAIEGLQGIPEDESPNADQQ